MWAKVGVIDARKWEYAVNSAILSVRAKFTGATWPGTGRVVDVHMYGLTMREIAGRLTGEPFLSRLAQADIDAFAMPADPPDLVGYVEPPPLQGRTA